MKGQFIMKRYVTNDQGFTLIEMMIVLAIISVLLLIIVPNITKNSNVANEKSCEATIKMVQGQVGVYISEHNGQKPTSISQLRDYIEDYDVNEGIKCPDGTYLGLNDDGKVIQTRTKPNNG